jgi:HAD superfamily hydrolase (TIGR01509 family)
MPPAPIEAVIFDADGTLVDSEELGLEVLAQHARAVGVPLEGLEISALRGKSMASNLQLFAERLGQALPDDFEQQARARMAEVFERHLVPMPGAREVVEGLAVPCCVATNGPRHKVELTLRITGLLDLFQGRIFSGYELGTFKPAPGLFLAAAAALGVEAARCAVVEDSEPGLLAGLAAGMRVFAVRCERPLPPQLAERVEWLERLEDLLALAPARERRRPAV